MVQVDGGLSTGRDVVIGALLGADEFGFATAPLIAAGCIMMRMCHLNTCPVGVATQDPELRKRFNGQPEHVINYFFFVAEEVREIWLSSASGRSTRWSARPRCSTSTRWHTGRRRGSTSQSCSCARRTAGPEDLPAESQNHHLEEVLDRRLIEQAQAALESSAPVKIEEEIRNTDRSVGAMLRACEALRPCGIAGRHDSGHLKGTAGQSFRRLDSRGVTFDLEGEGNDYVGKGLSGGSIIVKPPGIPASCRKSRSSSVTPCFTARSTANAIFAAWRANALRAQLRGDRGSRRGWRPLLRIHDRRHVVVIGETGRNFAAGMSGGIAYVLDEAGDFAKRCNMAMVELEPILGRDDMQKLSSHWRHRSAWAGRRVPGPARFRRRAAVRADLESRQAGRFEQGRGYSRELEDLAAEIPQSHAGRIPPRAEGYEGNADAEPKMAIGE